MPKADKRAHPDANNKAALVGGFISSNCHNIYAAVSADTGVWNGSS